MQSPQEAPGIQVLVVEEEHSDRPLAGPRLTLAGLTVYTASTPEDVAVILEQHEVDVLVSNLPGDRAAEVLARLPFVPPDAAVVLMRSCDRLETLCSSGQLGYCATVPEDAPVEKLIAAVREAARRHSAASGSADGRLKGVAEVFTASDARAIFESLPSALIVADPDGYVVLANQTAGKLARFDRRSVEGQHYTLIPGCREILRAFTQGFSGEWPVGQQTTELTRADGTKTTIGFVLSPWNPPSRRTPGIIFHFADITQKVQMETALIQADKLATLGTMASALAHDINNPMAVIIGSLETLIDEAVNAEAPFIARLKLLERTSWQCVDIVRNFLKLSRGGGTTPGPVQLADVLRDILSLLGRELSSARIEVVKDIDLRAPLVDLGAAGLQQILLNLIVNARDAMPDGGRITIGTCPMVDGRLVLEIRDTGTGIAPEILPRVFDLFFTTKAPGKGTGLGLAICRSLLRENRGELEIESQVGVGTTARVHLPVSSRPAHQVSAAAPGKRGKRPPLGLRVFVVDDEVDVLALYTTVLEREGCRSTAFTDPEKALRSFEPGAYDLALLDLRMPGMDGFGLCRALHAIEPALPILLCSGTLMPEIEQTVSDMNVLGFVQKPFRSAALREWLERVASTRKRSMAGPADDVTATIAPHKLLIVDDDFEMCEMLKYALEYDGRFLVETACEGQEALVKAFTAPPSLIMLDLMMPGMNGYEICRRLKSDARTSSIPVVIHSVKTDLEDVKRAMQVGALHYIMKPTNFETLSRELLRILELPDDGRTLDLH
ncbi:MAG: response regulator [Candidatus Wallbacteria bacterium]|nr:response regulator [Candidatus Wallbacteria bacterium]